jgi:hypothetical protein
VHVDPDACARRGDHARLNDDGWHTLKLLSVEERRSMQALVVEALKKSFVSYVIEFRLRKCEEVTFGNGSLPKRPCPRHTPQFFANADYAVGGE